MSAAAKASSKAMPHSSSAVREHADLAQRGALGAGRERGADLAGDDAQEGHRRRLQVDVVQRRAGAGRVARAPAGAQQHVEEAGHDQRGARSRRGRARPARASRGVMTLSCARPRRAVHERPARPARGPAPAPAASRCRGRRRGSASRSAAAGSRRPPSAKTRNGHDLGRRVGEDVDDELADVVVDAAARPRPPRRSSRSCRR